MPDAPARRHDLDAIRGITILIVVVYHVFYMFNSSGLPSQVPNGYGIHALDVVAAFPYPWFMLVLFVVAGISMRYALAHRTPRQFMGERVRKLIVPLIGGWALLGWVIPLVQTRFPLPGSQLPFAEKLFAMYIPIAMGVLWFLLVLFIASLVVLLFHAIDRHDRLYALAGRMPLWMLVLLVIPVWGSSMILNAPMVTTFRFGIYIFGTLLGYIVFSHPDVTARLKKAAIWLLGGAIVLGVLYAWTFWGQNWGDYPVLEQPLTNAYAWVAVLGILGGAARWLDRNGRFIDWLRTHSFPIYVVHYEFVALGAWLLVKFLGAPMPWSYLLLLVFVAVATFVFIEITMRIPGLRFVLYGMGHPRQKAPKPDSTALPNP